MSYFVESAFRMILVSKPENVAPTVLASDPKFINNIEKSLGMAFGIEVSKVSVIHVEVVSLGSDFGDAQEQDRNRMLRETEQELQEELQVEYRLVTESAQQANSMQVILKSTEELARVAARAKTVLSAMESASGRPLLIKGVSLVPAIVTAIVGAMSPSIAPSSTLTTTRQEEKGGSFNAIMDEIGPYWFRYWYWYCAAIVGCLSLGCLDRFLRATCQRGPELSEQSNKDEKGMEDLEAGSGQQDENSEMYPTLLKVASQSCSSKAETKPGLQGFSESITSVSTACLTIASNTSVSTAGTDTLVKPIADTQNSGCLSTLTVPISLPAFQENRVTMVPNFESRLEMQGLVEEESEDKLVDEGDATQDVTEQEGKQQQGIEEQGEDKIIGESDVGLDITEQEPDKMVSQCDGTQDVEEITNIPKGERETDLSWS